jgi:hypothetical protein
MWRRCEQGDQIGRIFAYWVIVYFGMFLIAEVAYKVWLLFSAEKVIHYICQKLGWATFWAIFNKLIWLPWNGSGPAEEW